MPTPDVRDVPLGTRHVVGSDTGQIEYFSSGGGPVVVLLPALAGRVTEYNPLVQSLTAAGYRTLALHLPGVGGSRRRYPQPPTLQQFADEIAIVLRDAEVPAGDRVFLIGRALGNRVARMFATTHPQRVQGVVLLAAGGKVRSRGGGRNVLRYLLLQVPGLPLSWRRRLLEPLLCARRQVLPDFACRRPPLRGMLEQAGAAQRTKQDTWWSGGTAPILVLQGEQDRVAPPENARLLREEFPDRVEVVSIPNAGHALMYDAPETVEREVLRFLNTHRET